jgi:hypothetical protein
MLDDEPLLTLPQAAKRFPGHRGADSIHPATLARWITDGAEAVDGRLVRLEARRVGARWLTSDGALNRFSAALAAPDAAPDGTRSTGPQQNAADAQLT